MGRKKKEIAEDVNLKGSKVDVQVPIEAQEKLIRLMNDSPTIMKLHGTEWEIHSLKPAVQWLICEEATEIVKVDNMTIGDVLKAMAKEMPRVVRVMAYAMLNDKDRIFNNYRQRIYSDEFEKFWAAYPKCKRKGSKLDASKTFKRYEKSAILILGVLEKFKGDQSFLKNNGEFIPSPGSWLNKKHWENEFWLDPVVGEISVTESNEQRPKVRAIRKNYLEV